jgi:hypothetical protein
MALRCRSGLLLPLATPAMTCCARGEPLCARTKSARSFKRGDCVPCRIFSRSGTPCSGIHLLQAHNRQQLEVIVILLIRRHRLARALTHRDLERSRIVQPSAHRIVLQQLGDSR